MALISDIFQRKSCRTFNGLRPAAATSSQLRNLGMQSTNELFPDLTGFFGHCTPPVIRLIDSVEAEGKLGTYGFIKGARTYFAMSAGNAVHDKVMAGFMFEHIVLECTRMHLGTCWIGGTFSQSSFQKAFDLAAHNAAPSAEVSIICPVGHPTEKARFAERFMRRISAADTRKPFNELFSGIEPPAPSLLESVITDTAPIKCSLMEKIAIALECVRRAPSSTNSQPWSAKVTPAQNGSTATVSFHTRKNGKLTPFDMGIAYQHFHVACRQLGLNSQWTTDDDSLLSISVKLF